MYQRACFPPYIIREPQEERIQTYFMDEGGCSAVRVAAAVELVAVAPSHYHQGSLSRPYMRLGITDIGYCAHT